jgi:hypothetical protein
VAVSQNDDSPHDLSTELRLRRTLRRWWQQQRTSAGFAATLRSLTSLLWEFIRESTPEQRRQRYGDADYDWEHRVDTTGGSVTWRDRLMGMFHSAYQPTQPDVFHQIIESLEINFPEFVFIDIGSGKGRALLMASDYPFRGIIGVELLPGLNRVATENIAKYKSGSQRCFNLEAIAGDARHFVFPAHPTVLYLFNPLPETGMAELLANLERSLHDRPRPVYVIYHNPVLEHLLASNTLLKRIKATHQYVIYAN